MVKSSRVSGRLTIFTVINTIIMLLCVVIFAFPMYYVVISSFIGDLYGSGSQIHLIPPANASLDAYRFLLMGSHQIFRAYGITIFRVTVGTTLNMIITVLLSYGLSKKQLPGIKLITFLIFFTMLFSGGLIPTYFLIRTLGLINSAWVLIIPVLVSPWYAILLRNYFFSLPAEIEESAVMDGAHPLQVVFRIIIPLSMASISTIGLFYAVMHWNSWIDAVIYLNTSRKWPVQLLLRQIMASANNLEMSGEGLAAFDEIPPGFSVQCAAIVVTTLPILCVYPFIQKYFVKGVMVGAVKG